MKFQKFALVCSLAATAALTGCTMTPTASPVAETGGALRGIIHGGQQPVVGARVYLYAANTTGYGGPGIAASSTNASISLLKASVLTNNVGSSGQDSNNQYYVLTDNTGGFSIDNDYTCTEGQQVYLYALGGNPGAGTNAAAGFMALMGECPTAGNLAGTVPFVYMNEVSTAAASYAIAQFASDATHVSTGTSPLASTGLAHAFATAANLATVDTATALAQAPTGATAPQLLINTVANILAACVNASDTSHTNCNTLFENATADGVSTTSTGNSTNPDDTVTAAIYLAQHPGSNVSALFGLQAGVAAPFTPDISATAPHDMVASLLYSNVSRPYVVAVDGSGNIWAANSGNNSVLELDPTGATLGLYAPTGVFNFPIGIAIDTTGSAWIANDMKNNLVKLNSSGTVIATTPATLDNPGFVAIDTANNVWNAQSDTVGEVNSSGTIVGTFTPSGANYSQPSALSFDTTGNVWVGNSSVGSVTELNHTGGLVGSYNPSGANFSTSAGAFVGMGNNVWIPNLGAGTVTELAHDGSLVRNVTLGTASPWGLAIDSNGTVWVGTASNVTRVTSTGTVLGYYTGTLTAPSSVRGLAVDPSGNLWMGSFLAGKPLIEMIGVASPVVTPIVANLLPPYGSSTINKP
jgi:streptogramin lyase